VTICALGMFVCCRSEKSKPSPTAAAGSAQTTESGAGAAAGSRALGGADGGAGETSAGGHGAGAATTHPNWLTDSSGWDEVATVPGCHARVAREPASLVRGLSYETCGIGCLSAKVAPVDGPALGLILGAATRTDAQGTKVVLSTTLPGTPPTDLVATYLYGAGKPLTMLAADGDCLAQVAGRASPNLWMVFPPRGEATFRLGYIAPASAGSINWLSKTTTRSLKAFDFDSGWGGTEAYTEVFVAKSPTSLDLTSIYSKGTVLRPPAAHAEFVAWGEWSGKVGQIAAWGPEEPATVIASGAWFPAFVGVSAERVAWLGASGPQVTDGAFEEARVYWCERSQPLGACQIVEGPKLPITSAGGVISVHDHWISLLGCDAQACDAFIVDMASSKAYRVHREADHGVEPIGVSATELFVADFAPEHRGTAEFDRVIRYDLSKLSELATEQ
jgi:hypothetical protein